MVRTPVPLIFCGVLPSREPEAEDRRRRQEQQRHLVTQDHHRDCLESLASMKKLLLVNLLPILNHLRCLAWKTKTVSRFFES